jgi:hypothetical protein
MRKIITLVILTLAVLARPVAAQTSLTADRIYLGATGCALRTGAGTPTGGAACDFYFDTATGHVWVNHAGTWIDISTRTPTFQSVTSATVSATTKLTTPLIDTAAGNLALAPAGGAVVPLTNLGVSFGTPFSKFLALHLGELWAETLVASDVLATVGGRIMVAPTTMLTADLSTSATTITVKANTLQNGEVIYLQAAPGGVPQMEWMTVTSAASGSAGAFSYTVTRNIDGSGANQWYGGDAVVDTGTVGKGFIDLYALGGVYTGAGPSIVGSVRTGAAYNAFAPRWAIGNLRDVGYGHAGADYFGFAAGNPAGAYLYADDTTGIRMGGPGGLRVEITPAGVATFIGDGGGVTNIDGGHIRTDSITSAQIAAGTITTSDMAAGAITADKIAANTITVNELNATGYGDNLVKNGAFEPSVGEAIGAASALAGWARATDSTGPPAVNTCCGLLGPGTMYFDPGAGTYTGMVYLAVPIERTNGASAAVKYRVSFRMYQALPTQSLVVILSEYLGSTGGIRRVYRSGSTPTAPDVAATSETQVAVCENRPAGWTTYEYTYTPPVDIALASLTIYNASGVCGGTYTAMYIDDVEMQKQIGTGHISANSITANLIQAGAITADKIAAGAITAGAIAAGSITGDKIAANTITGGNIAADSITSAHIAAGTIVAADIATGTIDASKLNVTALSAISANLGSVTAGNLSAVAITGGTIDGTTIRGVTISASSTISGGSITSGTSISGATIDGSTIRAGGGAVTLDGSGITVTNGDGNSNARLKLGTVSLWGGGSSNLSSDGNFDIGAIRAHQAVDFEKTAHVYQTLQVDSSVTTGGYISLTGAGVYFQAASTTINWPNGNPPVGTIVNMGYNGACTCLVYNGSSARFKENLRAWTAPDPLAILSLPLYRYDFKNDPGIIAERDHVGFTVEDLVKLAPEAVARDGQGRPESFYPDTLDTYLLAALKAVNARVSRLDALTTRTSSVAVLEARVRELERKIAVLEAAAKKRD